jgi:hypothetical protein
MKSLRAVGVVYLFLVLGMALMSTRAEAQEPADSLVLVAPVDVRVYPVMNSDRRTFANHIIWEDPADEIATFIHPPDTTGWRSTNSPNPQESLSVPVSGGVYNGLVDRTVRFLALNGGEVGVGGIGRSDVNVRFTVIGFEFLSNTIDAGAGYTPGTPIECVFRNSNTGDMLDFGLTVSFSEGIIDSNGVFIVGLEDFEGNHMYRAINADGSDFINIGEVSKEEAFRGAAFDSLYYSDLIPALRATGYFEFPGGIPGVGDAIDLRNVLPGGRLGPNELWWVDRNAFNGFTYHYVVTTFDRDYNVGSSSQGLTKFDHCKVSEGVPYPCPEEIVTIETKLEPQRNLPEIYAVPNPYRSGSSQYTTENYHNYPDNKVRFVNTPGECELKVYTPAGDLVWEFSQTDGPGNIEWDTRNLAGEEVASGVYIFRLESASGNWVYGRLIIIR